MSTSTSPNASGLGEMLAERNAQRELASKVTRIGSFSYDYTT
jgi:hypothetical protein